MIHQAMACQRVQPRGEACAGGVALAAADHLEPEVLVQLVGERAVRRVSQEVAERRATVPHVEALERGCVALAEGEEILRRAAFVDIVLGPQTYHRLPEMVARATRAREEKLGRSGKPFRGANLLDTEFPAESKFDHLPEAAAPQGVTAFLGKRPAKFAGK